MAIRHPPVFVLTLILWSAGFGCGGSISDAAPRQQSAEASRVIWQKPASQEGGGAGLWLEVTRVLESDRELVFELRHIDRPQEPAAQRPQVLLRVNDCASDPPPYSGELELNGQGRVVIPRAMLPKGDLQFEFHAFDTATSFLLRNEHGSLRHISVAERRNYRSTPPQSPGEAPTAEIAESHCPR